MLQIALCILRTSNRSDTLPLWEDDKGDGGPTKGGRVREREKKRERERDNKYECCFQPWPSLEGASKEEHIPM